MTIASIVGGEKLDDAPMRRMRSTHQSSLFSLALIHPAVNMLCGALSFEAFRRRGWMDGCCLPQTNTMRRSP